MFTKRASDTGNVIEENTIVANTNGIFVAAEVQGNIFRNNFAIGNPGIQVSIDHTFNNGVDIENIVAPGANVFEGYTCLTSLNASCPSIGRALTARPDPIPVAAGAIAGQPTNSWDAPDAQLIEITPTRRRLTRVLSGGALLLAMLLYGIVIHANAQVDRMTDAHEPAPTAQE